MEPDALNRQLRDAADQLMSLNLDDLDVSELERRIALIRKLEALPELMVNRRCNDFTCINF